MDNQDNQPIFDDEGLQTNAKIKVIGVGGGGSNAVNQMIHDKENQVEYWVMNTDSQALANSPCENKLILGRNITRGLGAGGLPDMGKKAAEDSLKDISSIVKGVDMVFVAAGEGGGTGTGGAPVIAKAAKDAGCLVLGIVTRPFTFEGKSRRLNALEGINNLMKNVDALIVVSNDKLTFNNGNMSIKDAFACSDKVLASSVKTVTDLILLHGVINLDFADVKTTLQGKGLALIGIGYGEGPDKGIKAADSAMNSPLLEASIKGSRSMIINVTVGDDTTLDDVQYAINYITETANGGKKDDNECNIIFGVQMNPDYHDKMKIAIIATDFSKTIDFSLPETMPKRETPTNVVHKTDKESAVKDEIESQRSESPLPDYLKQFLSDNDTESSSAYKAPLDHTIPVNSESHYDDENEKTMDIPVTADKKGDDGDDSSTIVIDKVN
ncbi:MAG: cell division protein FtsZ [Bacilli bacterium]